MGIFSRYSLYLIFLLFFWVDSAKPISRFTQKQCQSTFSFEKFEETPNFDSEIALLGDARIVNGDSSVKITGGSVWSAGRVIYTRPIKFSRGIPRKNVSFSSYFSFSISPGNGDGLAFAILPKGFPSESLDGRWFGLSPGLEPFIAVPNVFAVEFDTLIDPEVGDPNGNHVGIDIGSLVSVKITDVSRFDLVLNSGDQLHCWIDYDSILQRLEVRLSKTGVVRPFNPLISHRINLSGMWEEEMFLSISSSSANSTQTSTLYSWSFSSNFPPKHMHSEPVDPRAFAGRGKESVHSKSDYLLGFLAALIFGAGCGAMAALFMLSTWALFMNRHWISPAEYPMRPIDFGYEKIEPVGEKGVYNNTQ